VQAGGGIVTERENNTAWIFFTDDSVAADIPQISKAPGARPMEDIPALSKA